MKTKLNLLMVFALLAALAGGTASPAQAQEEQYYFTWSPMPPLEYGSATFTADTALATWLWSYIPWYPGVPCDITGTLYSTDQIVQIEFGGHGEYEVCLQGWDPVLGTSVYDRQWVTVANVAPVFTNAWVNPEPSMVGEQISQAWAQADYADWDSSCTVDYGDGTGPQPGTFTEATCKGPNHTYTSAGLYNVIFSLTEPDGLTSSTSVQHQVSAPAGITIGPDDLSHAIFGTPYTQQLTVTGGNGSYTFSLVAPYLPNFSISGDGILSGTPISGEAPGSYSVTINVQDSSGATGSRTYTLVVDKVEPTMTVSFYALATPPYYYGHPFYVYASLLDPLEQLHAGGTVAFKVDGSLVTGCEAVSSWAGNQVSCYVTQALSVGERTITAEYTPAGFAAQYYLPTSGSISRLVEAGSWGISGDVFLDDNQNGTKDTGEVTLSNRTVSVSTCDDATLIATDITDGYGQFSLPGVPGGECVSVSVTMQKGWSQTTSSQYTLSWPIYLSIGIYNADGVNITLSPSSLPGAGLDRAYNQVITASGGTAPYTYAIIDGALPDGLALQDGAITGTPTTEGDFTLTVQATDTNGYTGFKLYDINVQQWMDGIFNLTSDHNPSAPGQTVTFTLTGTSNNYDPDGQLLLPLGYVKFQANGVDIPGCEQAILNYDMTAGYGNYPAMCSTDTLAAGPHTITASFTPLWIAFNPVTLTLTQQVVADTTAPEISYTVNGVFPAAPDGSNDWYVTDAFVDWTVTDPESAVTIDEGCVDTTINYDTAGVTLTCKATSAGGSSEPVTVTIKRDATAPINVSGAPDRDADSGTWYNHLVDVNFTGTDATSGLARCSSVPYSGPDGAGKMVNGRCTDNAGNTSAAAVSSAFDYDATAPINVNGAPGRDADSGTWYNHLVNVNFTGTDATSGLARCSSVPYSGPDGAGKMVNGRCTDNAGNTSAAVVSSAFDYDATKPVTTVTEVTEGSTYILGAVPQASCSTTDNLSGVGTEANLAITGGDSWGVGSITATCSGTVDNAGNVGDTASVHYTVIPATSADLSIIKTDSKDPVKPGATLVYTLTVSNAGPHTAESVTVVDTLDRNTTYVSVSAPKGWTCKYANYSVTCTSTNLTSGSSAVIKITVKVNKTVKVGKELVNNATVSSMTYDPIVTNNNVVQKTLVAK